MNYPYSFWLESSRLPVLRRADPAHLETDLLTYTQSVEYDEHVLCNVLEVVKGTYGCLYIVELMKTLEECDDEPVLVLEACKI